MQNPTQSHAVDKESVWHFCGRARSIDTVPQLILCWPCAGHVLMQTKLEFYGTHTRCAVVA